VASSTSSQVGTATGSIAATSGAGTAANLSGSMAALTALGTNSAPAGTASVNSFGIRIETEAPNMQNSAAGVFVKVEIPTVISQSKFEFVVPAEASSYLKITNDTNLPVARSLNASDLPSWLNFDPITLTFSANTIPLNSLPLSVVILSGNAKVILEIKELN
jgi:hypothetical protein